MSDDIVGQWKLSLPDGRYMVEFEHGTTTGKRVIRVNDKEIMRNNWMFKLVGQEVFTVGKHRCVVMIESASGFNYEYSLEVDGKKYEKFCENQSKILQAWTFSIGDKPFRCVLEKHTYDVWVNGTKLDAEPEFTENGTEVRFELMGQQLRLVTVISGHRRSGLVHTLLLNNKEIPPATS